VETVFDLKSLWLMVIKYKFFLLLITACATIAAFVYSSFLVIPQYESTASLVYETDAGEKPPTVNDLNTAKMILDNCKVLLKNDAFITEIKNDLSLNESVSSLKSMITLSTVVDNTVVLNVSVKSSDSEKATEIAAKFLELAPVQYKQVLKQAGNISVLNPASDGSLVSPNKMLNTAVGAFMGMVVSFFIMLLLEKFDSSVKKDDDLAEMYEIPVFAEIIDFESVKKV